MSARPERGDPACLAASLCLRRPSTKTAELFRRMALATLFHPRWCHAGRWGVQRASGRPCASTWVRRLPATGRPQLLASCRYRAHTAARRDVNKPAHTGPSPSRAASPISSIPILSIHPFFPSTPSVVCPLTPRWLFLTTLLPKLYL
jgi:hypothetical protein